MSDLILGLKPDGFSALVLPLEGSIFLDPNELRPDFEADDVISGLAMSSKTMPDRIPLLRQN
jgi:hypothetical protein